MKVDEVGPTTLLYWGEPLTHRDDKGNLLDPMAVLARLFVGVVTAGVLGNGVQPQQCVRADIPADDPRRAELAKILAAGETHMAYMGRAECRICGVELGCKDLVGYGFMWPEKAEHYITEHLVWTPTCNRLLAAARKTRQ